MYGDMHYMTNSFSKNVIKVSNTVAKVANCIFIDSSYDQILQREIQK